MSGSNKIKLFDLFWLVNIILILFQKKLIEI